MKKQKWIGVLEDDHRRRVEMFRWLDDRLFMYPTVWFRTSSAMNQWLEHCDRESILFLSLDHDLEETDNELHDAGSGRDVVDYLIGNVDKPIRFPVIVHSTNSIASLGMIEALREHDWAVHQVVPYDDLEWVSEIWYPTIKAALRAKQEANSADLKIATPS